MDYLATARTADNSYYAQTTVTLTPADLEARTGLDLHYTVAATKAREALGLGGKVRRHTGEYGRDGTFETYDERRGEILIGVASLE